MQKKLELLRKYKGYIICIIIILMASLSIFIQSRQKNERGNSNNSNNSNNIGVYVTGEIVNPGVYYLNPGSRLYDQTTPNMIQGLKGIFAIKPLISRGI